MWSGGWVSGLSAGAGGLGSKLGVLGMSLGLKPQ